MNSKELLDFWLSFCQKRVQGIRTQTIEEHGQVRVVDVTFRVRLDPLVHTAPKEQLDTTIPIGVDIVASAVERTPDA